jgi:hypothetical protein
MKQGATYATLTSTTSTSTVCRPRRLPPRASPASAPPLLTYTPSSQGISHTWYGQPKDQGSKHHQLAIGDPQDGGSKSSEDFADSPRRYCQPPALISPLVHFFLGLICIGTNGNALGLIVQVHGAPQRDDGNVGGTEHGDVPGLGVEVPKLQ